MATAEASAGFFASTLVPFDKALNLNCFSKHSEVQMDGSISRVTHMLQKDTTCEEEEKKTTETHSNTIKLYYICA